jgi:hypothetical protein
LSHGARFAIDGSTRVARPGRMLGRESERLEWTRAVSVLGPIAGSSNASGLRSTIALGDAKMATVG